MNHNSAYETAYASLRKLYPRLPERAAPGGAFDRVSECFEAAHWNKIYNVLLSCGATCDPQGLSVEFLNQIQHLCPFDQAIVYYFDGNLKYSGQYLVNVEERWSSMYLSYYAATDNQHFSCFVEPNKQKSMGLTPIDWAHVESTEFVPNYIRPRGLKYSFGFPLHDLNGRPRSLVVLDRVSDTRFSDEELATMYLLLPQLNSLHKNFYYQGFQMSSLKNATCHAAELTARESEIASLLCQGVLPVNISHTLYISLSTTYKHIAHIYEKLNVSSRQELLVRLLGKS